jgi:electron transfer flavoprotein beta subunit
MIATCLKWIDRRPEVDPLDGHVVTDVRTAGISDADGAALEWALRCGETWDEPVVAVTAGPPGAESVVRDALACGAARAVRVELAAAAPSSVVAASLAAVLRQREVVAVWCGVHSLDRGSGSVPAFLAAELGLAQALGVVGVDLGAPRDLTLLRRLDGGRRERLQLRGGGVLSVEGAAARLRRAPLAAALAARTAGVETVRGSSTDASTPSALRPYRPRARALAAPTGATARERIVALTDTLHGKGHGELVVLDPPAAAERILGALDAWGYRAKPANE